MATLRTGEMFGGSSATRRASGERGDIARRRQIRPAPAIRRLTRHEPPNRAGSRSGSGRAVGAPFPGSPRGSSMGASSRGSETVEWAMPGTSMRVGFRMADCRPARHLRATAAASHPRQESRADGSSTSTVELARRRPVGDEGRSPMHRLGPTRYSRGVGGARRVFPSMRSCSRSLDHWCASTDGDHGSTSQSSSCAGPAGNQQQVS